jgi:phage-related minor tail protein
MPDWRKTASGVWVGFVLLPIAAVTFFGIIGTMVGSGGSGGGSYDGGGDPTCYPSSRC